MSSGFDENDLFINQFIIESEEHILNIEACLLELEKCNSSSEDINSETINELFRSIHTIKGLSGMLEFNQLFKLTHSWETLLDNIRKKKQEFDSNTIEVNFDGLDLLSKIIENIRNFKTDRDIIVEDTVEKIESAIFSEEKEIKQTKDLSNPLELVSDIFKNNLLEFEKERLNEEVSKGSNIFEVKLYLNRDCLDNGISYMSTCINLELIGEIITINPNVQLIPSLEGFDSQLFDLEIHILLASDKNIDRVKNVLKNPDIRVEEVISSKKDNSNKEVEQSKTHILSNLEPKDKNTTQEKVDQIEKTIVEKVNRGKSSSVQDTIRVETGRLDNLLALLGEQVISKTQLEHLIGKLADIVKLSENGLDKEQIISVSEKLNEAIGTFSRLNNDLQENLMRIRMLPIGTVFNRFNRVVRDLSKELGKQINLIIEGEDTELDKTIIEEISDPLIHIIRNAIDHGIEDPETRIKSGKDPEGTLHLNAYQQGNSIVISIKDNGKGLKLNTIKNKAIEKGLISPNAELTDRETMNLIFLPGFSTAQEVTGISGRGVGMDVVRKNISNLRGTIEIESKEGEGTIFILKLPLTLAIIQSLIIKLNDTNYAIPLSSVIESYRATPQEIKVINKKQVIKLRDEVLPILYFQDYFKLDRKKEDKKYLYIVIIGVAENKAAFVVDKLVGQQEIVIKPLNDPFVRIAGIGGSTLIGEGITLIIDPTPVILASVGSMKFDQMGIV